VELKVGREARWPSREREREISEVSVFLCKGVWMGVLCALSQPTAHGLMGLFRQQPMG
jgi:hypothetical protein